ncbi:hypothetical protein EV715DRAFT_273255 [Schizophyllum commune]
MAAAGSKFQAFMNHPAGPKTVFFWAPLMKWCLVAAGLKDLSRPADKLSVSQNVALTATGFIWVRYSLVITPVNYSLAAVNFFVGLSGLTQLVRVAKYVLPAFAPERREGMIAAAHCVLPCPLVPRRRSSLRLLRSCLSSSVSEEPENEPIARDASPNMPPFSCK